MAADTPTRVAIDLMEAAALEGSLEQRSAKGQIDYWARIGQKVTRRDTASRRRIERCLGGDLPWSALRPAERRVANAELDLAIEEAADQVSLGGVAAVAGIVTVALDDQGRLCEFHPDGSVTLLP
ncbi:MAG: hypothetical protein JWO77_509 [Ilumatobacteraceae bacterium]|nr:hypothetical protein [Ilumatobacteraceae bacterium]